MAKKKASKADILTQTKSLESLIDAQLDGIVVGGWSRTVFNRVKPY